MSIRRGRFWAITSFFNPAGYRRRLLNYRKFRAALQVPLATVELSFDGRFELAGLDADKLVRVTDGDMMWQKERLLNLLIAQLPPECEYVAWIDADVLIPEPNWPEQAVDALTSTPLVQLFSTVRHLSQAEGQAEPREATAGSELRASSAAGAVLGGRPASTIVGTMNTDAHGLGLAARRELLERHGLYDGCVIGGGDTALLGAAYGVPEVVSQCWRMSPPQRDHYTRWAAGFYDDVGGRVGALAGEVHHLWHGDLRDRRYDVRHSDLTLQGFDPRTDIRLGSDGAWRWASDKPALHAMLRNYFRSRHEDGRPAEALSRKVDS